MEKFILSDENFIELSNLEVNLNEIYEASPFDHQRNWDGRLKTKVFNEIFHITPKFLAIKRKLFNEQINSKNLKRKVIFFTGYSGTGKTTFINDFISHNYEKIEFVLIDYNEMVENINNERKEPISDGIRYFIANNYIPNDETETNWLYETINFIYENNTSFFQLISEKALQEISSYIMKRDKNHFDRYSLLNQLLNSFDSMDVFTILLIILFKNVPQEKMVVLIFENLDIIELDYITKAFLKDFQKLHNNCSKLSQRVKLFNKNILFSARFKFVFILREATFSKNPHFTDQLGAGWSQFIFNSEQSVTSNILRRRKNIVDEMIKNGYAFSDKEHQVNMLIDYFSDDVYFDNTIINLYNRDIKKLVRALQEIFDLNKGNKIKFILYKSDFGEYEKRGSMIYWTIKFLKENNHLNELLNFNFSNFNEDNCDTGRLVLNYLLNTNGVTFNKKVTGNINNDKFCNLLELVDAFKEIIEPLEVIDFIEKGFMLHKELAWVNIISIYNKKMTEKNPFKEEKDLINKYYKSNFKKVPENLTPIRESLENIELSLTPAGYSLIKYIIIHFEYYSNRIKKEHYSAGYPLFYLGLKKGNDGNFLFEKKISEVIKILKKEASETLMFFNNIFIERRNIDAESFENSDFSFKYISTNNKSKKGVFHLTRVVSSQITYIDKFRLYLLKKESVKDEKLIIEINKKIISFIKEYISILEVFSIDSRKDYIINQLNLQITIIENNLSNTDDGIVFPEQFD